ncbi:8-oxo-dGTP diphosphatase [Streptacidiphilus sp. MAP12-33]|uniref:NUDIX domain-containing protein n=1 Tax=Streptacidiphilus sp. MAP12-33 TaxID=3156266 RepID=UPI003511DA2E
MTQQATPGGWLPPEQYVHTIANATFYGCLYFTDTQGRPLGLRNAIDPNSWDWPGGNVEPRETPWDAAVRECAEETGIQFRGGPRLLGVTFALPGNGWPLCHIGFVFDGGHLTGDQLNELVLDPAEHSEWRVLTMDAWRDVLTPGEYECLKAADTARRTGAATYLHHEPEPRRRPGGTARPDPTP